MLRYYLYCQELPLGRYDRCLVNLKDYSQEETMAHLGLTLEIPLPLYFNHGHFELLHGVQESESSKAGCHACSSLTRCLLKTATQARMSLEPLLPVPRIFVSRSLAAPSLTLASTVAGEPHRDFFVPH